MTIYSFPGAISVASGQFLLGDQTQDAQGSNIEIIVTPAEAAVEDKFTTAHQDTDWLSRITLNFKQKIIDPCSLLTRNAFEKNQSSFSPENLEGEVRMEIKKSIVQKLNSVFCGNGRPKLASVRKIADELSHNYPALYRLENGKTLKTGWKYGGKGGPDAYAKQLMSALQKLDGRTQPRKRVLNDNGDTVEAPKQTKKEVYGVDPKKFNVKRVSEVSREALSGISSDQSFEAREEIFSDHRASLQAIFNTSKMAIPLQLPVFFLDCRHLEQMFLYLTGASSSLIIVIEKNYKKQIEILEKVLKTVYSQDSLEDNFSKADRRCAEEFGGNSIYKDLVVFREAAALMSGSDHGRSAFITFQEEELDPVDSKPYLVGYYLLETWVFDIVVDKQIALKGLNLTKALGSYLHLCFTFNLVYPEVEFNINKVGIC